MTEYTPNSVVRRLVHLSELLDKATAEIAVLDETAVRAKGAFQVAYARSYLTGTGSIEARKHGATLECADLWLAYEIADQQTRAAKERIRTLQTQIEIGRSLGAAVRSEWAATGATYPT